jgi:hypothetical protein
MAPDIVHHHIYEFPTRDDDQLAHEHDVILNHFHHHPNDDELHPDCAACDFATFLHHESYGVFPDGVVCRVQWGSGGAARTNATGPRRSGAVTTDSHDRDDAERPADHSRERLTEVLPEQQAIFGG